MNRLLLILLTMFVPQSYGSLWNDIFGPSNYDECILENLRGIPDSSVVRVVQKACRSQFPYSVQEQRKNKSMRTYTVTDPVTNRTLQLTGDHPPTEEELDNIFSTYYENQPKIKSKVALDSSLLIYVTAVLCPLFLIVLKFSKSRIIQLHKPIDYIAWSIVLATMGHFWGGFLITDLRAGQPYDPIAMITDSTYWLAYFLFPFCYLLIIVKSFKKTGGIAS